MIRVHFKLYSSDEQLEFESVTPSVPSKYDHIFYKGSRYEVCQVQHHLDDQVVRVLATHVAEVNNDDKLWLR